MHSEALLPDENAMQETAEVVRIAEESGDDVALGTAHIAYGLMLSRRDTDAERKLGLEYLRRGRDSHVQQRISATVVMADIRIAEMTADAGDVQRAIENARAVVNTLVENDERFMRSAAIPTDPGFVLKEIQLLRMRALLARAHGDEAGYRDFADRYGALARSLGFEGHMAMAEAMR